MRIGESADPLHYFLSILTQNSIQFNIVSKGLGSERMSFYLNEAAGDIRDLLLPTLEAPKAKL
jgi:carnitine O-acetyltransferase